MKRYLLFRWCLLGLTTLSTLTGFSQVSLRITPAAAQYSVNQTVTVTVRGGTEGGTYTISALTSSTGTALSSVTILNGSGGNTLSWAAGQEKATFRVRFLAGSEGDGRLIQLINNADAGDIGQTGELTIIAAPVITVSSPPVHSEQQSVTVTLTNGIPGYQYVVQLFDGYPFEKNEDNELSRLISPLTSEGGINTIPWSATTTSGQFFVTFDEGTKGKNRMLVVGDLALTHLALTSAFEVITCPIAVSIAATPGLVVAPGGSVTLTASGASSYSWSTGASGSAITVNGTMSGVLYSVTGVSGECIATARATVSPLSLTASSPIFTTPLVLSAANCPVQFTGQGWGKTFVMTGPGGYAYTTAFRDFVQGSPITAPGIRQAGNYTLTLYGFEGQTPVSYPIQVTGSCN